MAEKEVVVNEQVTTTSSEKKAKGPVEESRRLNASRRGYSAQTIIAPKPLRNDDDEPQPLASASASASGSSSSFIVLSPPTPSSVTRPSLYHSSILLRPSTQSSGGSQQGLSPTPDSESDDGGDSAFSDSDAQRHPAPYMTKSNSQYSLNVSGSSSSGSNSEECPSPPMPMPIRTVTLGLGPSPYAASPSFISSSPRNSLSPVNSPPTEFSQPKLTKKRPKPLSHSQSQINVQNPNNQQQQQQLLMPPTSQHQPLTSLNKKSVFNNSAPALPCLAGQQQRNTAPTLVEVETASPSSTHCSGTLQVIGPMSPVQTDKQQATPPSPQSSASSSSSMSSSPTCKSDPEMGMEGEPDPRSHRKSNKASVHIHHRHHHHRHHRAADLPPEPAQPMPSSSSDNSIVSARAERDQQNANARPIRMPSSSARLMSYSSSTQKPRAADDSDALSKMKSAEEASSSPVASDSKKDKERRKSVKQPAKMRGFFDLISPMFSRVARFGKKKPAVNKEDDSTAKRASSPTKSKDSKKSKKDKKKKKKKSGKTSSDSEKTVSSTDDSSSTRQSESDDRDDDDDKLECQRIVDQRVSNVEGPKSPLRIELPTTTPPDTPTDSSQADLRLTPIEGSKNLDEEGKDAAAGEEEIVPTPTTAADVPPPPYPVPISLGKGRTEDEEYEEVYDEDDREYEDDYIDDDTDVCDEDEEEEEEEGTVPYYEEMYDPFIFIRRLQQLSESTPPELLNVIFQFPPVLPVLPPKALTAKKVTLVLDLDETLVHCSVEPVASADLVFPVEWEGIHYTIHAYLRPGVMEFMRQVSDMFEVVLFTASQPVYAGKICDFIDPTHTMIKHRLFRQSCVYADGNYVKDLRVLGRDLAKTVIIDNSPQAFAFQYDNGIPILSYFDSKTDRELLRLLPLLRRLSTADDVRPILRNYYKLWKRIEGPITPTPFSAITG